MTVGSRLLGWLTLAVAVSAAPASQPQNPPQFRAGTEIVAIDFLAQGPDGRPVSDLRADEITLRVDGRVRDLRNFQFVKLTATGEAAASAPPALAPPFATNNKLSPGRTILIVVDHEQIGSADGRATFDAASRFLSRLTPLDRVGLVTLPNGKIEVDLTTNHRRVQQALATIAGRATRRNLFYNISLDEAMIIREERADPDKQRTGEIIDRECRFAPVEGPCRENVESEALLIAREAEAATRATLQSLAGLFEGLAPIEGPKTVLFLSQSLVRFEDTHLDLDDVGRAAARARAQVFVLQLHKVTVDVLARNTPPERSNDNERLFGGLQDLAGATGGELFRLSGASDPVFGRIADQISAYYLVGFEPRREERDGKAHRIEISTRRRDVTIHVRPTYVIDDPDRLPPAPSQATTMLRDRVAYQDLPLRVTAYPFRDPDPQHLKIVVAVETVDATHPLTSAAFALVDVAGARAAEWTEEGANVVRRPLLSAAAVPPGEYRLRVAAIDAGGRRGAVEHEFVAALTDAAPFVLAPLMLGWNEAGAFRPRLLFERGDASAVAYLEMYGGPPPGNSMGIVFEIAERPDGPALATSDAKLIASNTADRRVATGELALSALPAGDYVVRAIVSVNGQPVGRVSRTLRKQ